jgi:methionine synthase II (cobalamin-independent)
VRRVHGAARVPPQHLGDRGQVHGRLEEPYGFFPLEQLALSTQCGFASAGPGNQISEDARENKLRLVGEVADRVWG